MSIRIADLFCGIGGIAEAVHHWTKPASLPDSLPVSRGTGHHPRIAIAIDIDRSVAALYQRHHGITPRCSTIESLKSVSENAMEPIGMWWMSPPCQPYTRRGLQRGSQDSRSHALGHLIKLIPKQGPRYIGLENVPAFEGSEHHQQLQETLNNEGYQFKEYLLCPSELGIPMKRRRYYLLAKQGGALLADISQTQSVRVLADFIHEECWHDTTLQVPPNVLHHYESALNIIDIQHRDAIAACFTSAYGKSHVKSGSYLRCPRRGVVRRFSPNEIANLMGFRESFFSSSELSQRSQYRLIGNSLAVHVVYELLSVLFTE
jgi:site-specific DNA-cytosine methylase